MRWEPCSSDPERVGEPYLKSQLIKMSQFHKSYKPTPDELEFQYHSAKYLVAGPKPERHFWSLSIQTA